MKSITTGLVAAAALPISLALGGCLEEEVGDGDGDSELRVSIEAEPGDTIVLPTDEPGIVTHVVVDFDTIELHHGELGWIERALVGGMIDLLHPRGFRETLATLPLPSGRYDQIRFGVEDAGVFVDERLYPLEIPSGDSSGLKVHTSFCVDAGVVEDLTLRWHVRDNLHWSDNRGFWLTPSLVAHSSAPCIVDER